MLHRLRIAHGAALACAAGSYAYNVGLTETPRQSIFSWGRLVPAGASQQVSEIEKSPVEVLFWKDQQLDVKLICYGRSHGAAVDRNGGLWAWSSSSGPTPCKLPCTSTITSLASTDSALYATTTRGQVLQWTNLAESLGNKQRVPCEPQPLGGALRQVSAVSMAAGADHLLVIGSRGEVVGLGDNRRGQLGLGDRSVEYAVEPIRLPPVPAPAVQAACGDAHSIVLLKDGSCVSFGDDRNLQLGLRSMTIKAMREGEASVYTPTPVSLFGNQRVVAVAAGGGGLEGGHSAFLLENGELYMSGHGRWGQLGSKSYTHISSPRLVSTLAVLREWDEQMKAVRPLSISAIACGERHTAVLLDCGSLFVWGWNQYGQLGNGTTAGSHTPTMLKAPPEIRYNNSFRHLHCGPNSTVIWS